MGTAKNVDQLEEAFNRMAQSEAFGRADWQHLLVSQLERIEAQQVLDSGRIYEMHGEVSGLKVRSSIFGVLGGLISALLMRFGMHAA